MNNNKINMSVLALGCGVLSIAIGLMGGFSSSLCALFIINNTCAGGIFGVLMQLIGIAAGVVGTFLALNEQKTAVIAGQTNNMAAAALVVSIIGIAVAFIGTICVGVCTCKINQTANAIYNFSSYF